MAYNEEREARLQEKLEKLVDLLIEAAQLGCQALSKYIRGE